jgi:hypothetical protein
VIFCGKRTISFLVPLFWVWGGGADYLEIRTVGRIDRHNQRDQKNEFVH